MNVASDFISQYTTRQEYRSSEAQPVKSEEWHLSTSSRKIPFLTQYFISRVLMVERSPPGRWNRQGT